MIVPILIVAGGALAALWVDANLLSIGLHNINPLVPKPSNGNQPPLGSGPIPPPATTRDGNAVIFAPALPSLPPLPPGQTPAIPSGNQVPPINIPGLSELAVQVLNYYENANDPTGPIVAGDLIQVDLRKAGVPIPANLPIVGRVYMEVVSLKVPGDSVPPQKLIGKFIAPELAVLGPQPVNRAACTKAVRTGSGMPTFETDQDVIDLDNLQS